MKQTIAKIGNFLSNSALFQRIKHLRVIHYAIIAVIVVVCILSITLMNMHAKYTKAIDGITEQIFQKIISMEELFSYVDDENVDVRNKLIPQLKAQYTAALELNNALVNNFGARYSVFSVEQIDDFDNAFKEYSTAIASGLSLNLARDDMAVLLAEMQDMINARYNPTAEPTQTPVIIKE